jgi:hypothetical protein
MTVPSSLVVIVPDEKKRSGEAAGERLVRNSALALQQQKSLASDGGMALCDSS